MNDWQVTLLDDEYRGQRKRTARKAHECWSCTGTILPGETYLGAWYRIRLKRWTGFRYEYKRSVRTARLCGGCH